MLTITFNSCKGDIHIIAMDGCNILLNPDDPRLSPYQRACAQQDGLRDYLLYENIGVLEEFHVKKDKKLKIYCPTCNTEYFLAERRYKKLLNDFCSFGKNDWFDLMKSKRYRDYLKISAYPLLNS